MPVNPKIQLFLNQLNALPKIPMDQITPEEYRKRANIGLNLQEKIEPIERVENHVLHLEGRDIPIRVYIPEGQAPFPALVYYHGGGWVIGSLDSHDSVCRGLANVAGCIVISVDYRLAPEHKFPAAVEDAYDSLRWIAEHAGEFNIDPNRIAVGGDSAGGNLAAVASIIAKEKGTPKIVYQLLIYPSTGSDKKMPSIKENDEGYFLTGELMWWFRHHYFNKKEDILNPYASPLLYHDLSGLPPAAILTAQYDPLRDIGKAYGDKLEESGVPVWYKNYDDLIHGFANFRSFVPEAQKAVEDGAMELKKWLEQ